ILLLNIEAITRSVTRRRLQSKEAYGFLFCCRGGFFVVVGLNSWFLDFYFTSGSAPKSRPAGLG
ncbi:hypothetical protein, partial [Klebsiella pneumoniae]|uniref:hypothetical protein n=1 Tax=Klebsiella pneumoniae TaxID=573 RepID=UPI003BF22113